MPFRTPLGLSLALTVALLGPAVPARADGVLARAGSTVGGFLRRVGRVFLPTPPDPHLEAALDSYAKGAAFTTYLEAGRVGQADTDRLRDEADLLAGVSAADLGLREEAAVRLRAVLETAPTSPYYAVALAALLDLDARLGNSRAGAKEAARYVADFWDRPRSQREADIKAVFLEGGEISSLAHAKFDLAAHHDRDARRLDRPAERALYLCGVALVAEKEFAEALVCLDPLTPKSLYFAYARYAAAQAYYGLQRLDDAVAAFADVHASADHSAAELFLKDRAALAAAQLLHEADEHSAAVSWCRRVGKDSPFALHAALLAAEVQADQEKPALGLVYLKERPEGPAEPKLAARAAALDAELHRALGDSPTAATRLEEGLKVLATYSDKLAGLRNDTAALDRLTRPLARLEKRREQAEAWRRKGLASGIPDLLDGRSEPGWAVRLLTSAAADPDEGGDFPVIYYPRTFDPFNPGIAPKLIGVSPPSDMTFPSLFRHAASAAVGSAFRHERALAGALKGTNDTEISLVLLDTLCRLRDASRAVGSAPAAEDETITALGFGDEVLTAYARDDARPQVLLRALREAAGDPALGEERHEMFEDLGARLLERWREHRRSLVREAVTTESKAVQELRFTLDFELSQTLSDKKETERKTLQGS